MSVRIAPFIAVYMNFVKFLQVDPLPVPSNLTTDNRILQLIGLVVFITRKEGKPPDFVTSTTLF